MRPPVGQIAVARILRIFRRDGSVTPLTAASDATEPKPIELSVVMPCLNEADTLGICIEKAIATLREHGIAGEVIVADNGSTDGSVEIARALGARVVHVSDKGYGRALMGGIASARGRFVIMGDADDSYDFREVPRFLARLREGYELVQGCRLEGGGGTILPGAMPLLHRWVGNPLFSFLARRWFQAPVHDVYCGLRGFTKDLYERLDQRCTGMEFATEMIVKASLGERGSSTCRRRSIPTAAARMLPISRTFRDGWRTLRFFLLFSPRWLFLVPGSLLMALGLAGYALAMPGTRIRGVSFDAHTLLFASLALICGYQSIIFAVFTKIFAIAEKLLPADPRMMRVFRYINLEVGLIVGAGAMIVGGGLLAAAVNLWRVARFGPLDYAVTMRLVVPGVTLTTLGFQTVLSSFFMSVLGMKRH